MREVKIKLSESAREVLARSTITTDSVKLPEQLDRKLYLEIDKIFKAAGGKWNRGRGVHLFARDPREVLGLAVEVGAIVDTRKTMQQFFTPAPIAALMVERAKLRAGMYVLEPSAGGGALLRALRDSFPLPLVSRPKGVLACEIDPKLVEALHTKFYGFARVYACDFLKLMPREPFPGYFDRVLMNPPFTSGQAIAHIQHALTFLRPGGLLVAICPDGPKENEVLKPFAATWEQLPAGTFRESGTDVKTVLLSIQR